MDISTYTKKVWKVLFGVILVYFICVYIGGLTLGIGGEWYVILYGTPLSGLFLSLYFLRYFIYLSIEIYKKITTDKELHFSENPIATILVSVITIFVGMGIFYLTAASVLIHFGA